MTLWKQEFDVKNVYSVVEMTFSYMVS